MQHNKKKYDVIVVGVGGMGSSTTYHLARRGLSVLGLEQYNIPHNLGSSHGITRIIRLCYYEHPSYVPLLIRAFELWKDLENTAGEKIFYNTGSLDTGAAGDLTFEGSLSSCRLHNLEHEVLNSRQVQERYPAYHYPENLYSVYQKNGGFILPERSIVSHVVASQSLGAEIRARETVLEWEALANGVRVRTQEAVYEAEQIVFTSGAWLPKLIPEMRAYTKVERQVLGWFQPLQNHLFTPEKFPVFNIQVPEGRYYGLPVYGVPGFKLGRYHHLDESIDAEQLNQECSHEDQEILRQFIRKYLPHANGPTMALAPCMFTNTGDEHFIIDRHPQYERALIVSPCSGHGFKFCSVVGEIAADLVQVQKSKHDISLFKLNSSRAFKK